MLACAIWMLTTLPSAILRHMPVLRHLQSPYAVNAGILFVALLEDLKQQKMLQQKILQQQARLQQQAQQAEQGAQEEQQA